MFIRMFLYAKSSKEAVSICNDILSNIDLYTEKKEIVEIAPYWKIEGIFQIELSVVLKSTSINNEDLERLLKIFSNIWLSYGQPIDEILILDSSIIYNEKIEMINIFFDSEKIVAS